MDKLLYVAKNARGGQYFSINIISFINKNTNIFSKLAHNLFALYAVKNITWFLCKIKLSDED